MHNENPTSRLSELWEKHYFVLVKFSYVLLMAAYMMLYSKIAYRNAVLTLAAAAVCACVMTIYETTRQKKRQILLLTGEIVCVMLGMKCCGSGFIVLLPVAVSDAVSLLKLPYYLLSVSLIGMMMTHDKFTYLLLCLLTAVIYWQHSGMILKYRQSAENYEEQELQLKNSIETSAADFQNEIRRTNLHYETLMLRDKERLSQELHDKLGHRINGSIYQLEACRAVAASRPEAIYPILTRVIDSLREGMDEIRSLLRRERPDGRRMALIRLHSLCEECRQQYGIDAEWSIHGDSSRLSEEVWNMLADNCCEAVTNALKYADCDTICIELHVLNRLLRCCISDNGRGCDSISDGMGLQGMKRRVGYLGGTIDISGSDGFKINMLIPID